MCISLLWCKTGDLAKVKSAQTQTMPTTSNSLATVLRSYAIAPSSESGAYKNERQHPFNSSGGSCGRPTNSWSHDGRPTFDGNQNGKTK